MANDFLSDEEYLDSLLDKISQDDGKVEEKEKTSGNRSKNMSDQEMDAAADKELQKLLKEGLGVAKPDSFNDISIDQLIAREKGDANEAGGGTGSTGNSAMDGLNGSDEDLLGSLDSIVREIKGDVPQEAAEESSKTKKVKKTKKEKKEKKAKKEKSANSFSNKIKNAFFKVEVIDPEKEEMEEAQRLQEKEEKKKAKEQEKEQEKAKKLENKKAAEAKKRETAQIKKQEKEKRIQEKKAKKAEMEAALGPEERVKFKPAFFAFVVTLIAVMAIVIVLVSENYSYQNAMTVAQRNFANKKYVEAYQALSGIEIKEKDQMFYDQVHMMVRLDKQYNSYVNYKNLQMPKEALNALIQGLVIYYAYEEEAQTFNLEAELNEQKETLLYSLASDFGLDEEKAKQICEQEDSNEYTREIELYSANQIQ